MNWTFHFVSADKERLKKEIRKQLCPDLLKAMLCEQVDLTIIAAPHTLPGLPAIEQYGVQVTSTGNNDPTYSHGVYSVQLTKLI